MYLDVKDKKCIKHGGDKRKYNKSFIESQFKVLIAGRASERSSLLQSPLILVNDVTDILIHDFTD